MAAVPPAPRRSRILVADDDPLTRLLVREMLVAAGHDVCEAASGNEAVQQCRLHAPDLVLLDVRMPDAQASASDGIPLVNGALQDVTSLRRSEPLADDLARHDEFTGLDNRRGFTEQRDAALARLRESGDMSGNRRPRSASCSSAFSTSRCFSD